MSPLLLLAAALAASVSASAATGSPFDPAAPRGAGDTIDTAIPIPSLPFLDTGNTCAYADNYDVMCPYGLSAGDVVYSFTPLSNTSVEISLCQSAYDSKLYVWENEANELLTCNDDYCGADGYRSLLFNIPFLAGNTYYVVVDGAWLSCGDYELEITEVIGVGAPIPAVEASWGRLKARYRDP